MAYKILNGHVILESKLLPKSRNFNPTRDCNAANIGKENQLMEPNSNLKVTSNPFFYSIQKLWNQIVTPKQAKAPSVEAFQRHFEKT